MLVAGPDELNSYLSKRFLFDTAVLPQYDQWSDKRKYLDACRRKKLASDGRSGKVFCSFGFLLDRSALKYFARNTKEFEL